MPLRFDSPSPRARAARCVVRPPALDLLHGHSADSGAAAGITHRSSSAPTAGDGREDYDSLLGRVAGEAGQYHRLLVPGQYHKETARQKTQDEPAVVETLFEDGAPSNTSRRGLWSQLTGCFVNSIAGMCAALLTSSTGDPELCAAGLKLLIGVPASPSQRPE